MHLEFWGRTWLGKWMKFSQGSTDMHGEFSLPFDMMAAHHYALRSLRLEIYQTGHKKYVNGKPKNDFELFKTIPVTKTDLVGLEFNVGLIQLFYWEYRRDMPFPRVIIKDHHKDAPQDYAPGRVDAVSEQFIPIEIVTKKHLLEIDINPHLISMEKIQSDYAENLTVWMEKEVPGITRTDEWFGMRLMNGMYASNFDRDPERPELYWIHYHWSSYDHNDSHIFPNVSIRLKMQENGYLIPVEIELTGRLSKNDHDPKQRRVFTPADGDKQNNMPLQHTETSGEIQ
jgi:hypothetical protein